MSFGRPPLRERGRTRAFARYLLLSAVVWALAAAVAGVDSALVRVIELDRADGASVVSAYRDLALRLLAVAAVVGGLVTGARRIAESLGANLADWAASRQHARIGQLARALAAGISGNYVWDRLLARLRHSERSQLVRVRLRDGGTVYGIFAAGGRADYDADGRGILLDVELVEQQGTLVRVDGGTGTFVAPEAVASVSFASIGDASGGKLHSERDD